MPNWCSNRLEVAGPAAEVKRFQDENRQIVSHADGTTTELPLSFEARVPTPPELMDTEGWEYQTAYDAMYGDLEAVLQWPDCKAAAAETRDEAIAALEVKNPNLRSMAERVRKNLEFYGFKGWYGWRTGVEFPTMNGKPGAWGTKWNLDADTRVRAAGCELVVYEFDTAWSPPDNWIRTVAKLYPLLRFELSYEEEGCDFTGRLIIAGGAVQNDVCRDLWEDDEQRVGFISDPAESRVH